MAVTESTAGVLASTLTQVRAWMARFPETVALASFLGVFLFFAIAADNFLTPLAISNILSFGSIIGIVVVGVALLMITGEFDLSVGSNFAVASFVFADTLNAGVPPVPAMLLAVLVSTVLGAINGLIVISTGITSFITTVGTLLAYRGIARAIGGGDFAKFTEAKPQLFTILNGDINPLNELSQPAGNFQVSIIWFFIIAVVMSIVLMRTRFGNWIFAAGGNAEAALAQGVPVKRVKLAAFMLTGFFVGVASVMQFADRISVDPLRGVGMELIAVAASVIGGIKLTGGVGTILGACTGILLLRMLEQGLVLLGLPIQIFQATAGLIMLLAVVLNVYLSRSE